MQAQDQAQTPSEEQLGGQIQGEITGASRSHSVQQERPRLQDSGRRRMTIVGEVCRVATAENPRLMLVRQA